MKRILLLLSATLLLGVGWQADRLASAPAGLAAALPTSAAPPNIVWIVVDDMSLEFGAYGDTVISTPNVDQLAAEGVRFDHAIITAPVCSPARSALITGMYQTSVGAHHHRSGRGELKIHLPQPVRLVPELLRDAGYQTLNLSFEDFTRSSADVRSDARVGLGRTDYNFEWDENVYDRTHWRARDPGQPFFAQVQLPGGKLRGPGNTERWPARVRETLGSTIDRDAVVLPPYLPDDPVIREDWAQYLDAVRYTDWEVGRILRTLEEAGELANTVVFFLTDHGISHIRNKQFLYEGGIRIPLVVRGPGIERGAVRGDVVEHIDIAAATLARAGVPVPEWMQARDILAADYQPRRYAFATRDRMDETVDRMRAVRSTRYKYIANFHPARPYLQPNVYKDNKPIVQAMRRVHAEGKLDARQALIMAEAETCRGVVRPADGSFRAAQSGRRYGAPERARRDAARAGAMDGGDERPRPRVGGDVRQRYGRIPCREAGRKAEDDDPQYRADEALGTRGTLSSSYISQLDGLVACWGIAGRDDVLDRYPESGQRHRAAERGGRQLGMVGVPAHRDAHGLVAQRMLSVRNETEATAATLLFNVAHYLLAKPWPWSIVALASLVVFPTLDSLREAFPGAAEGIIGHDLAYPAMLTLPPRVCSGWSAPRSRRRTCRRRSRRPELGCVVRRA